MPSKSIHVAANGKNLFFFMAEWGSTVCVCVCVHIYIHTYVHVCVYIYVYHVCFIHLSVDRHIGCFHILPSVNNAVMNTEVYIIFSK